MAHLSKNEAIAVSVSLLTFVLFAPVFFSAIGDSYSEKFIGSEEADPSFTTVNQQSILDFEVQDLVPGTGAAADFNDVVHVHYVGQVGMGDTFDTSTGSDEPFAFTVGTGEVITGWDLGIVGMREGGTRRLIVPSELAYGEREFRDSDGNVLIPSNATLVFDVVLLRVDKAQ